ncbi:MAG: hypothetical protein ACYSUM_24295, partial [Planctomycetota bacterium]
MKVSITIRSTESGELVLYHRQRAFVCAGTEEVLERARIIVAEAFERESLRQYNVRLEFDAEGFNHMTDVTVEAANPAAAVTIALDRARDA